MAFRLLILKEQVVGIPGPSRVTHHRRHNHGREETDMKTTRDKRINEQLKANASGGGTLLWTVTRVLAVMTFVLGTSALSMAGPCDLQSLQAYMNLGAGGCTYNDVLFSNFKYMGTAEGTTPIEASAITVGQDFIQGVGYGLIFSANWTVTGTEDLDSKISYDVTVLKKSLWGEVLVMNGAMVARSGSISVTEDTLYANLKTYAYLDGTQLMEEDGDGAGFRGKTSDHVTTEVYVSSEGLGDSTASLSSVSNLFDVPEPGAMLLCGSGLVVSCLSWKWRRPGAGWRTHSRLSRAPIQTASGIIFETRSGHCLTA